MVVAEQVEERQGPWFYAGEIAENGLRSSSKQGGVVIVGVLSIDVLGNDSYAVELQSNMNRALSWHNF